MTQAPHNPTKAEFESRIINGLIAIYKQLDTQNQLLERIATTLEKQPEATVTQKGSRYMRTIDEFKSFDWSSIGATILRSDKDGLPDVVRWGERIYKRRAKPDQDNNVWFSCSLGEGAYDKLITFLDPGKSKRLDIN